MSVIVPASTPTTGQQIEAQYGIPAAEFAALSLALRSLFRAAYAADVLHVVEGAAYSAVSGEFTPGPPYNNVGPDVNRYLLASGAQPGEPWCAAFRTCMLLDSGANRAALPSLAASVHGWLSWAEQKGYIIAEPIRGCAGLIIESATAGHLVSVTSFDAATKTVDTIEGNTNEGGSRDGYGVFRRTRPTGEFHSFVDLSSL